MGRACARVGGRVESGARAGVLCLGAGGGGWVTRQRHTRRAVSPLSTRRAVTPAPPHPTPSPTVSTLIWQAGSSRRAAALSLGELRAATNNFSMLAKVGEGGFGTVFRASALGSLPGEEAP